VTFRYRRLDAESDMTFGRGGLNFLVDSPEAVGQSILTRLMLWRSEWFLDLSEGTPWMQQILGKPRGPGSPDAAIRQRILGTPYVLRLIDYSSALDRTSRHWMVRALVDTAFGRIQFTTALPLPEAASRFPVTASVPLAAPQARLPAPHTQLSYRR
jgi:hypothetical protein